MGVFAARKSKKVKSLCPSLTNSESASFDTILVHAVDLSSEHRTIDALSCFELAVSISKDEGERHTALFNLAVLQKDLQR